MPSCFIRAALRPHEPQNRIVFARAAHYRSRWLREPPLQAMMSSCTWDYFLTSDELGKFLGIKEDDLKPILSRVSRSGSGDDTFLRTCGIRRRQFNRKSRYCLLGCGNLVTLGPELCVELLAIEPQPLYW